MILLQQRLCLDVGEQVKCKLHLFHFSASGANYEQNKTNCKPNNYRRKQYFCYWKCKFLYKSYHAQYTPTISNSRTLNTLSPDMKMHILLTVGYTLLMELVRRICQNIKTSYPWRSLSLFLSSEYWNK